MSGARKIFEKLDKAVQKEWKDKAEAIHKNAMKESNDMLTKPPSTEPADRQRCIDNLVRFIKPILDGIAERTGFVVSVIAGGPEPQDSGHLNCISVHLGTTPGDVKMDWAQAELQAFKKYIFPSMARFCKRVFSVEECRSRALPTIYEVEGKDEAGDQETEDHAFRAGLEEVNEEGVELFPVRAGGGIRTGGREKDSVLKKAQPVSEENVKEPTTSKVVKTTPQPEEVNATQTVPTQPRQGLCARKRVTQSSPIPAVRSANTSPSRSPSPYTRSKPGRSRARGRMTVSSPIAHHESPPFTPPRHTSAPRSLPPSPIQTPTRAPVSTTPNRRSSLPPSLPPSPTRSPVQAPMTTASVPPGSPRNAEEPAVSMEIMMEQPVDQASRSSSKSGRKCPGLEEQGGRKRRKKASPVDSGKGEDGVMEDVSGAGDSGAIVDEPPVLPHSAPDYVVCTYELAMKEASKTIPEFERLVSQWLVFEEKNRYKESPCLKTKGRPKWVGLWFGKHQNPEYAPLEDAAEVLDTFWAWWKMLQPEWRVFVDDRPVPERYEQDR
ncbi:SERTA domain-containing protein 3 [Marasmius crinis-equi]|uniref:SERTA domain-containing protein 3 n=1 Tax=Marasmius crinis-equi TaxID=585013 RepID=A0ABR3EWK9_9AGAR